MNSEDVNYVDDGIDETLRERLQSISLPDAPMGLSGKVRRRIVRRAMVARGMTAVVVIGLVAASNWLVQRPGGDHPALASAPVLEDELLVELFAPPPVDALSVLDRRQHVALQALGQMQRRSERGSP